MNPEEQVEVYKQTVGPALYILSDSGEEEVELDSVREFLGGKLSSRQIGVILKKAHESPATPLEKTGVSPSTYSFRDNPSEEIIENSREIELGRETKKDSEIINEAMDKIDSGEIETKKDLNRYLTPYAEEKTGELQKTVERVGRYHKRLKKQYNGDMPGFLEDF